MPEKGWLNDPNGLCQFKGIYHIYYQYDPFDVNGKRKYWGHYTTKDFLSYKQEEIFLKPDTQLDIDGAYSGSAFVEEDMLHFFYTGNIKLKDKEYDYINSGRISNTIYISSNDGYNHNQKHLLMQNKDYPNDMTNHVRDPQVIKINGFYYMVLGARDKNNTGCVLLYKSLDLKNWKYINRISLDKPFGYMWECPNLFEIQNQFCLVCCPQGINKNEKIGNKDIVISMFIDDNYKIKKFYYLDRGFDFYAPQIFKDEKGRLILIAWLGSPENSYKNPTTAFGWQHALTMPRELTLKNGVLTQKPLFEFKNLRELCVRDILKNLNDYNIDTKYYELIISFDYDRDFHLYLSEEIIISYQNNIFIFDIEKCGCGRSKRYIKLKYLKCLRIFVDTSSLEIFFNDGEETFSTRIYPKKENKIKYQGQTQKAVFELYYLKPFKYI